MNARPDTAVKAATSYTFAGSFLATLCAPVSAHAPDAFPAALTLPGDTGWLAIAVTAVLLLALLDRQSKLQRYRDSEYRKQLDALPHIVWRTDEKGRLLNMSGAFSRLTGISLAQAKTPEWVKALHPDDRDLIVHTWRRALDLGESYTTEFRMRMADGEYRFFESHGTPICDDRGEINQWIGTIIDIHDRKMAELALVAKEANLRLAVEGANIGFWDWNIGASSISFSEQWKKQLGLNGSDFPQTLGFFQNLIHPDDFDDILALRGRIEAEPQGQYCIEYRLAHADGSYRWMLSPATVVEDDAGNAVHLLGANIDITDRKEAEQRLEHQATHDDLLNLPNRRMMKRLLANLIQEQTHTGLIFIDLDDFKAINDSIGHDIGDDILRVASDRISSCLGDGDTLCRPDGDEFVVLVSEHPSREEVLRLTHRIQRALDEPIHLENHRLFITATMGVSLYPDHGSEPEQLLRYADAALYRGKLSGKNCIQLFDPRIAADLQEWSQIKHALQSALQREELSVVFQPQVDLESSEIVGFEALARWYCPELGQVAPDRFIPVAEASGMIDAIGEFVLGRSIALVAEWSPERQARTRVAVNISARQLHQFGFAANIKQMVRAAGIPSRCIELEITETGIMEDFDAAVSVLNELTEAGFRLTIDDFGTGYCNLSYLKRLNVSSLKIDRSFIRDMTATNTDGQIVEALIALAHKLGMSVTAEGVERIDHLELLREMLCETGQGYYFSEPLSPQKVVRLLQPHNVIALNPKSA